MSNFGQKSLKCMKDGDKWLILIDDGELVSADKTIYGAWLEMINGELILFETEKVTRDNFEILTKH